MDRKVVYYELKIRLKATLSIYDGSILHVTFLLVIKLL